MTSSPLIEGPFWYRNRIRRLGPIAALIVPATLGAIAIVSLKVFERPWSGAVGLIAGVFAAPGLLVVGAPFGDTIAVSAGHRGIGRDVGAGRRVGVASVHPEPDGHLDRLLAPVRSRCAPASGSVVRAALVVAAMVVGQSLF